MSVDNNIDVEVVNDTLKGTTFGDPDGPPKFIETLGVRVPTFIDPRLDLLPDDHRARAMKRLNYHVPFQMRGDFTPHDWPVQYFDKLIAEEGRDAIRINEKGFVLCNGEIEGERSLRAGRSGKCNGKAVNRSRFCRMHGGGLHPADKKLSVKTIAPMPQDRIDRLDRVSKFMQGLLPVEELADDEITGGFVRDSNGRPVSTKALGRKFEEIVTKELQVRLNNYLRSKAPKMLEVVTDIAENDLVEPADRLKAAIWAFERVGGKTPEVILNGGMNEKPYQGILDTIESGSREDYRNARKQIESSRVGQMAELQVEDEDFLDAEEVDLISPFERRGSTDGSETSGLGDSGPGGIHNENGTESLSVRQLGEPGSGPTYDDSSGSQSSDTGTLDYVEASVSATDEKRKRAEEIRKARQKAKQRRFAARAVGATSLHSLAFIVEWKIVANINDVDFGKFKMKLHHPDEITEKLLERVEASNDETRQMAALAQAAASIGVT